MDKKAELNATDALLDLGVRIPILTPNFLKRKGRTRSIIMYRPMGGTLVRIARKYLKMGVQYDELENNNFEQDMKLMANHCKLISEMVALCIVRGWLTGFLFHKIVAWWLRWRVHPAMLRAVWWQMLMWLNLKDFLSITKSASVLNVMSPKMPEEGRKIKRS